jgi:5'-3' exonuclease
LGLYVKNRSKDSQILIYSSDKDFHQLVDENVSVIRPSDGKLITIDNFKEVFGYTHKNALFFKCFEGDDSDNIDGVKGVGLKNLKTYFPRFFDEKYSLDMLIKEAEEKKKERPLKIYDKIIEGIQQFQSVLNSLSQTTSMLFDAQFDQLDKRYKRLQDTIIGDTEEANQKRLEAEKAYQAERAALEKKAAKTALRISLAQALANTAEAITKLSAITGGIGAVM